VSHLATKANTASTQEAEREAKQEEEEDPETEEEKAQRLEKERVAVGTTGLAKAQFEAKRLKEQGNEAMQAAGKVSKKLQRCFQAVAKAQQLQQELDEGSGEARPAAEVAAAVATGVKAVGTAEGVGKDLVALLEQSVVAYSGAITTLVGGLEILQSAAPKGQDEADSGASKLLVAELKQRVLKATAGEVEKEPEPEVKEEAKEGEPPRKVTVNMGGAISNLPPPTEKEALVKETVATLLSNRAASYLQISEVLQMRKDIANGLSDSGGEEAKGGVEEPLNLRCALADAKLCTELRPKWPKAWWRLGCAATRLDRHLTAQVREPYHV
jgi:hypothetical protein